MKISIACLGLISVCGASEGRASSLKNNGAVCSSSRECESDCCSRSGSRHVCTHRHSGNVCVVNGHVPGGGEDAEGDNYYDEGNGKRMGNVEDKGNRHIDHHHNTEAATLIKANLRSSETRCGCSSCTASVLDRVANRHRVEDRINWIINNKGQSEKAACDFVCGEEFPSVCGECSCDREEHSGNGAKCTGCSWDNGNNCPDWWCNESRSNCNECTGSWFGDNERWGGVTKCKGCSEDDGNSCLEGWCSSSQSNCNYCKGSWFGGNGGGGGDQKPECGGAVDSSSSAKETCEQFLWGPTGDKSMHCFAYGGSGDPCHLNNNNDLDDGIFKDPSLCSGDTFYLWDEPDTHGRNYTWAGTTWLEYSKKFSRQLNSMRSLGTKVTGPLLKAGNSSEIEQHMRQFFDACGSACFDPANPAYIDVIAINGFCGPWNGDGGCYEGASSLHSEASSVYYAFNLPVYITNWSRLQTTTPEDQIDAMRAIYQFFPYSSTTIIKRVYWFGAKDYGGGSETSSYLTNTLSDGRTLGELWREICNLF
ncbi:hypothetical protein ACHAW6_003347 [Cyclotella cf. meneghiniana]